jgi:adenylate cyclase
VKHGARRKRVEVEVELHPAEFATLWRLTKGRRVRKTRYTLPYRRLMMEVDVYHGRLRGLVVAEVEFSSERQRRAFAAPDWVGREVSTDTRYDNRRLAEQAAPLPRASRT